MDYSEFDSRMKPLESQIADLNNQIDRLQKEQADLCKKFLVDNAIPLETKVIVTTVKHIGYGSEARSREEKVVCFVTGRRIERNNRYTKAFKDVVYNFSKAKKDGTMSQIRQYFWNDILNIEVVKG